MSATSAILTLSASSSIAIMCVRAPCTIVFAPPCQLIVAMKAYIEPCTTPRPSDRSDSRRTLRHG